MLRFRNLRAASRASLRKYLPIIMPTLAEAKSANAVVQVPHSVALFVGGTSGIGQVCGTSFHRAKRRLST